MHNTEDQFLGMIALLFMSVIGLMIVLMIVSTVLSVETVDYKKEEYKTYLEGE